MKQLFEHPSLLFALPSSQPSLGVWIPSPHLGPHDPAKGEKALFTQRVHMVELMHSAHPEEHGKQFPDC